MGNLWEVLSLEFRTHLFYKLQSIPLNKISNYLRWEATEIHFREWRGNLEAVGAFIMRFKQLQRQVSELAGKEMKL